MNFKKIDFSFGVLNDGSEEFKVVNDYFYYFDPYHTGELAENKGYYLGVDFDGYTNTSLSEKYYDQILSLQEFIELTTVKENNPILKSQLTAQRNKLKESLMFPNCVEQDKEVAEVIEALDELIEGIDKKNKTPCTHVIKNDSKLGNKQETEE